MTISIDHSDPAAEDLRDLAAQVRRCRQEGLPGQGSYLLAALDISETRFGSGVVEYRLDPGRATEEQAAEAYRYLVRRYRPALVVLCEAIQTRSSPFTIEVSHLVRGASLAYSHHDLVHHMPRILAHFRGRR